MVAQAGLNGSPLVDPAIRHRRADGAVREDVVELVSVVVASEPGASLATVPREVAVVPSVVGSPSEERRTGSRFEVAHRHVEQPRCVPVASHYEVVALQDESIRKGVGDIAGPNGCGSIQLRAKVRLFRQQRLVEPLVVWVDAHCPNTLRADFHVNGRSCPVGWCRSVGPPWGGPPG